MPLLECFLGANKIVDLPVYFNDLFHYLFFDFCLFVFFLLDLVLESLVDLTSCTQGNEAPRQSAPFPIIFRRLFIVCKKRVDRLP